MKVVQCWDDGVTADIRLIDILRRHKAKATFNLNADLHGNTRDKVWEFKETKVQRLGKGEMVEVYEGFKIANHSLSHPRLETLSLDEVRVEIRENRKQLQDFFRQPIDGFAYPFGSYNDSVMDVIQEEGHAYARTTKSEVPTFPPQSPFAFHPSCRFLAEDFWGRYEASKQYGVFYFWGHSYEMISEDMWSDFENKIKKINEDPESEWCDVADLFG